MQAARKNTPCFKKAPTLASCRSDKHGLILIHFSNQHQHTLVNDVPIQLSLSFHFCLLYYASPHRMGHNALLVAVCLSVCHMPDPKSRKKGHDKLKIGLKKIHDTGDP